MRNTHNKTRVLAVALVAITASLAPTLALAEEEETVLRSEDPGFRTELGLQLSIGGHSCIAGGSGYADCKGTNTSWDTNFGMSGGLILRPFNRVSAGIDIGFFRMTHHQDTGSKWTDFTIGPIVRYHHPVHIRKLYFEPNIGLTAGWVKAVYHQAEHETTNENVNYDHLRLGAYLAIPLGLDFFPLPKLGLGLEFRLIRTFYNEICFEWKSGVNCRGSRDEAIVKRWEDDKVTFPGEKGIATYPWKPFWGVHGVYYF